MLNNVGRFMGEEFQPALSVGVKFPRLKVNICPSRERYRIHTLRELVGLSVIMDTHTAQVMV